MSAETRFDIHLHDTLDSTNEEAKRMLQAGAISRPLIIRARTQTAGKGTQGRRWLSPPGTGLYFSIVHPNGFVSPDHSIDEDSRASQMPSLVLTPLYTLAAGIATAETLRELTGLSVQLKPVNDLYVDNRKLGGILTESLVSSGTPTATESQINQPPAQTNAHASVNADNMNGQCRGLITGIGINVLIDDSVEAGCAEEARGNQPTSLQACLPPHMFTQWHSEAVMEELCLCIAQHVDTWYARLHGDPQAVLARYQTLKLSAFPMPAELARLMNETCPS